MHLRGWLAGGALVWVTACTSLEDFQSMSAAQRADEVCTNSRGYKSRASELRELEQSMAEKQETLERGYRLHRQCRQVIVPAVYRDCSRVSDKKQADCQRANANARDTLGEECFDTPVAIDADYEAQQLSGYRSAHEMLSLDQEESLANCREKVGAMDAAEAWQLYRNDSD